MASAASDELVWRAVAGQGIGDAPFQIRDIQPRRCLGIGIVLLEIGQAIQDLGATVVAAHAQGFAEVTAAVGAELATQRELRLGGGVALLHAGRGVTHAAGHPARRQPEEFAGGALHATATVAHDVSMRRRAHHGLGARGCATRRKLRLVDVRRPSRSTALHHVTARRHAGRRALHRVTARRHARRRALHRVTARRHARRRALHRVTARRHTGRRALHRVTACRHARRRTLHRVTTRRYAGRRTLHRVTTRR